MNNKWRLISVILVVAWAVLEMTPMQSRNLIDEFELKAVNADATFDEIVAKARELDTAHPDLTFDNLLEAIGDHSVTNYFPGVKVPVDRTPARAVLYQLQKESRGEIKLGLDLQGGVSFIVGLDTSKIDDEYERSEALVHAEDVLRKRVDKYGVAEPIIQPIGNNELEIQMPGLNQAEAEDVRAQLTKPAVLEFRLVHKDSDTILSGDGIVPPLHEVLYMTETDDAGNTYRVPMVVKNQAEQGLTGKYLDSAGVYRHQVTGAPEISLKFNNEGATLFGKITTQYGNTSPPTRMAIILDGEIYSAPNINGPILGGLATITGDFTEKEAFGLVNVLENPLEIPVEIKETLIVDPTLGKDSIKKGIRACIIGIIAVAVFMLVYYMLGGLVANVALVLNVIVLLGVLASIDATLTLPGIAGIVLTIGMAIDANVLIFERIREEIAAGKSLKGSIAGGYDKVFSTIFDANITTLIASILLIIFGTGPVKGFGTTLTIGIAVSMFTALVVTRMVLEFMQQKNMIKSLSMLNLVGSTKIDFIRWSKPAFIASWVLIAAGVVSVAMRGSDLLSHEFKGGDQVTFSFVTQPDTEEIRAVLTSAGLDTASPQFQTDLGSGEKTLVVNAEYNQGTNVNNALTAAFADQGIHQLSINAKGPSIGLEIQRSAIEAALLAVLGILIYVAFRFEFSFAIGASIAVLHDVLITIGIFAFTGRQFDATMVAAILTIIGFSINDTIVVFDRIHEDLKLGVRKSFRDIINLAINQTLSRTIITSGTTFLSALALFVFGGVAINNFAFTFLVGIIVGTYSTIYMAAAIVLWWNKGQAPKTRVPASLEGEFALIEKTS